MFGERMAHVELSRGDMIKKAEMEGDWALNLKKCGEWDGGRDKKLSTGPRFERVLARRVHGNQSSEDSPGRERSFQPHPRAV